MMRLIALSMMLLISAHASVAAPIAGLQGIRVLAEKPLDDPALEARARTFMQGIRCLVCQNQSIEESDADMARDLRILIREKFANGEDEAAITDFLLARYGDWILMNPPLSSTTLLLWFGPFLLLFAAGFFILRRRTTPMAQIQHKGLTADEEARLKAMIDEQERDT